MKKIIIGLFLLSLNLLADFSVMSEKKQSVMIELFSSQGCSSCPPAEKWLNGFTTNPELWKKYIPLSFHVTYWDNLGWKDPFAQTAFTQRQKKYKNQGHTGGVYTPGFLVNAREWRGNENSSIALKETNVLSLTVKEELVKVKYYAKGDYRVHVALLGFGLETEVLKGENRGELLKHDFVVLKMNASVMQNSKAELALLHSSVQAQRYALVAWVTPLDSMQVLQSVGSWLD